MEFLAVFQQRPFIDFSPSPSPSPLLPQCDRYLDDCVGALGWVAGIASHGSVILSRGRLVTVETPGHPRHPSSIQHDAVVTLSFSLFSCKQTKRPDVSL